jgi:hypothetical protein
VSVDDALDAAEDTGACPALQAVSTARLDAAQKMESFRMIMAGSKWRVWIRRGG